MTKVIVVSGAGGVGKTTSSAALSLALARSGRRTLLVSVDPARRLADVVEQPLGDDIVVHKNVEALSLWMPNTSTELTRIAKAEMSPEGYRGFEANRVTELFHAAPAGLHEAACALSLGQVAGAYDVVVIDTPPCEQSTSFLEAPARLRQLFQGHALALFSTFGSARGLGQRVVERMLDRVMPAEVIAEGADFFRSILSVRHKLAQRAARADALLSGAHHVVVAATNNDGIESAMILNRSIRSKASKRRVFGEKTKDVVTIFNRSGMDDSTQRARQRFPSALVLPLLKGPSRQIVDELAEQLVPGLELLAPPSVGVPLGAGGADAPRKDTLRPVRR
ncbi:MAG: ArsA family ATPase [Polyangiales bacterium]